MKRCWATGIVGSLLLSLVSILGDPRTSAVAATTVEVNVRNYGAMGDGVANDTAAIQRANDAVAKTGGRVFFPAGTYVAGGVVQDSGVEFYGSQETVLKHPNGVSPSSIVKSRRFSTTGTITRNSTNLRVTSISHIAPGVMIAVRGAGELLKDQSTDYPYLYAKVVSVSGLTVVLARPALVSVTGAAVSIGSTNMAIRGITLDGNKPAGGSSNLFPTAVEYVLARNATISGCLIRNGLYGAVKLDLGTADSVVENNTLTNNGAPWARLGAAVWMFRGSSNNIVRNNVITGGNYVGVTMDDRTQGATDWDGSADGNLVEGNEIDYPEQDWNMAILVTGGNNNTIRNNIVRNVQSAIVVDKSIQGQNPRDSRYNVITGNSLTAHKYGLRSSGSYNQFTSNTITATWVPIQNTGTGNTFS